MVVVNNVATGKVLTYEFSLFYFSIGVFYIAHSYLISMNFTILIINVSSQMCVQGSFQILLFLKAKYCFKIFSFQGNIKC